MNMQPHQSLIAKQGLNGSSDQLGSIVKTSLETCSERQDYALEERKQEQLGNASLEAAVSRFRTKPSSDSLQMNLDMDISASSERATPGRRRSSRRWSRSTDPNTPKIPELQDEDWAERSIRSNWKGINRDLWYGLRGRTVRTKNILMKHPFILLWSLGGSAIILGIGIFVTHSFAANQEYKRLQDATDLATHMGLKFSEQLEKAILPLYSLIQFVFEIKEFYELPRKIGQAGNSGSLPLLPPIANATYRTHRNVSGLCDDPELIQRFGIVSAKIKNSSDLQGILVNLQLAPMGVVCLLHPVNNTEDFPPGDFLDNTGAIGHDLLSDPDRSHIAAATITAGRVLTAGPLTLKQCQNCSPLVESAFIARLPIYMNEYTIEVNGIGYHAWGFAVALINWQGLVDRIDVYDMFADRKMGFELSRTDIKCHTQNNTENSCIEEKVILAEYKSTNLCEKTSAVIDLDTTDNLWKMKVGYPEGLTPSWVAGTLFGIIMGSILVFILVFLFLAADRAHYDLLRDIYPKRALQKMEMGKTIAERYPIATVFFSDVVGYSVLSSTMSATSLMEMMKSLFANMDRLTDEYGVYKIETIGDAYMCTGGCPDRCSGPEGAEKIACFAMAAIKMLERFEDTDGIKLQIRVGISSGPLVAGVVGEKKPHYTVFGDAVNVAARMESTSQPMKIQCSDMTYSLLRDAPNYDFQFARRRGTLIKGKGDMDTWFILGSNKKGGGCPIGNIDGEETEPESTRNDDSNV